MTPLKNVSPFKFTATTFFLPLIICLILLLSSCRTTKPVPYLQGNLDSAAFKQFTLPEPLIQKGDILGITIYSDNPVVTAIYNQAGTSAVTMEGSTTGSPSYLVDSDGNIRLHAIGLVHVEGLTKKGLSDLIVKKLITLQSLSNPYCIVSFQNFKITVIGEVGKQGVFTLPDEKANVIEAIGLAGGITDYGRKDNVLLMREDQGKREFTYLDLTKASLLSSPYFNLHQNDVLVIDADPRKQTVSDQQNMRNLTIALSIISTVALLANLALRF